ncbi:MAG: DUF1385 domain-containing protein [Chitinispirillaceae bacterium]|nr:DUF1385 domain-containing protein [Chitinispirillaceae bacterium]
MMKKILSLPVIVPFFSYLMASKKRRVGGQAVIEGVMMRGRNNVSWAVRKNEQEMVVERREFISICKKYRILARPVFRGAINLFESLVLGYRALTRSVEIVEEEQRKAAKEEGKKLKEQSKTGEKIATGFSLAVSLVVAFGVFMYLPMWILSRFVPKESALLFNTLAGVLRVIFFLVYLILISLWKEIRRVFEYHGAEHMAIYTYEAGQKLTFDNMRRYPTLHPRCGTSFLFLVMMICILLFSVVDALYISFIGPYPLVLSRVVVHLLLTPVVAGVSYEVLKLSDKYQHVPLVGFLIQPGLWLQKITTKKPDDSQLEVAAKALRAAL